MKKLFKRARIYSVKTNGIIYRSKHLLPSGKTHHSANPNIFCRIYSIALATVMLAASIAVSTPAAELVKADGWYETLYAQWSDRSPLDAKVEYKLSSESDYIEADNELIRNYSSFARVDIPGIKSGTYDIKITASDGSKLSKTGIKVEPYDRSGYAHFKYTDGVGAYNDDGTIKDNAKVLYVTEENKDTVSLTVNGKTVEGIGNILNSGSTKHNKILRELADNNIPLVVRIIGKVTNPEGTTIYNSTGNGGSVGDNGHMARMRESNNVTIEGIGYDAKIFDWGIHFIASVGYGRGFEVRNLTFENYPEDAVGMEGVQEKNVVTASVERCWIHHNSFLPGYCERPAESDKKEGDGSCDFKRGKYYTLAYNYFVDCHKTNLIGASDDNLQFNITFHHNWWKNCASRGPLVRQSNMHLYNNYYQHNTSTTMDSRANSFLFAEYNFMENCKNPMGINSGSVIKSFNNTFYDCLEENSSVIVSKRDTEVPNNNALSKTFDTDADKFYYDPINKKSDVERLTSAIVAKSETIAFSGAMKENPVEPKEESVISKMPVASVKLPYSKNFLNGSNMIAFAAATALEDKNVIYKLGKKMSANAATAAVLKDEAIVFKLNQSAKFTMDCASGSYLPILYNSVGEIVLTGSGSVIIPSGVYMIQSSLSEKEAKLNSFSIEIAKGDLGGDGLITSDDISCAMDMLIEGTQDMDEEQLKSADINGNGRIDIEDVIMIMSAVLYDN